jgi:hypothetical protein
VSSVLETLSKNVATARRLLGAVASRIPIERSCDCAAAPRAAVITAAEAMNPEASKRLALILGGAR